MPTTVGVSVLVMFRKSDSMDSLHKERLSILGLKAVITLPMHHNVVSHKLEYFVDLGPIQGKTKRDSPGRERGAKLHFISPLYCCERDGYNYFELN